MIFIRMFHPVEYLWILIMLLSKARVFWILFLDYLIFVFILYVIFYDLSIMFFPRIWDKFVIRLSTPLYDYLIFIFLNWFISILSSPKYFLYRIVNVYYLFIEFLILHILFILLNVLYALSHLSINLFVCNYCYNLLARYCDVYVSL